MNKVYKLIINTLRRLTWDKIWKVSRLGMSHPLFSALSLIATFRSFALAQKYFPHTNSTSGIGNAFRHALWSCLIMMYCCKISSPQKAADWCVKMTDLHEELFPNEPEEKFMDLHNNRVGLNLFFKMLPGIHRQFFETGFFIDALLEKTKTARILENLTENYNDELIYLK